MRRAPGTSGKRKPRGRAGRPPLRPRAGSPRPAAARFRSILLATADGIAVITLNRPEARNAINLEVVDELRAALDRLARDGTTRALILTGAGKVSFASGADIRELRERCAADALRGINSSLFLEVERFPLPTIAAVNGYALGGGCELALACDLRIAAESAHFGQPEVGLGIIPAAGATYRLPRIVGAGRARELILTGRIIDADEALQIGLVNRVVPDDRVLEEARSTALLIARKGPLALRAAKLALQASLYGPDAGHDAERLAQAILFESDDKREGTTAFLEGRPPRFTGR
ncbi:MAG TPA: enoyl-CoA hydratase-related protein [Candidatus Polarisedimenticolia bacterium]|nr:enoyl-CoA hydratase-related protein [Candidatus Polarisedimenticolia bacterium]